MECSELPSEEPRIDIKKEEIEPEEARDEPVPSTSAEPIDEKPSRSITPRSSSSSARSVSKSPTKALKLHQPSATEPANAFFLSNDGIKIKRMDVEENEPFEEEILERQGKVPIVPEVFTEWISFKLEHFFTGIKLRPDSDYGDVPCPVPIESGFKRYYCTAGTVTLKDIREMLEKKFCNEKKFSIYLVHPNFMDNLDEEMTLNMLAIETKWQRKRPLRILFTMIPPKEPPPSLEKEPMLIMAPAELEPTAMEEEEVQVINAPILQQQIPMMLTPAQLNRTPELQKQLQSMQMMTPQCHQMLTSGLLAQKMSQQAPMKRKRENENETTPPSLHAAQLAQIQQQQRQIMAQHRQQFNPQNMTPQQLQTLTMFYQKQQGFIMPPEVKNARIASMASNLTGQPGQSIFPVAIMPGGQMKSLPVSSSLPPVSQPSQQPKTERQNAALLHKLLLQQQQASVAKQKQKEMWEQQQKKEWERQAKQVQAQQQLNQHLRAQQIKLQQDAVAAAQKLAQSLDGQPPTKKMALQEALETPPRFQQPIMATRLPTQKPSTSSSEALTPSKPSQAALSTPTLAAQLEKKNPIQPPVPSPPSPPKHQATVATPSPPAISPIPPKIASQEATLKPYAAQVSVQPITNVNSPHSKTSSPAPALSPAISIPNNIDIGTMAKLKNQSLGRTLKETFAKNHRPNSQIPLDTIRAQHIDGQLQISAPTGHLELLRNSTIVPTL